MIRARELVDDGLGFRDLDRDDALALLVVAHGPNPQPAASAAGSRRAEIDGPLVQPLDADLADHSRPPRAMNALGIDGVPSSYGAHRRRELERGRRTRTGARC